jgi:hypothetical protein
MRYMKFSLPTIVLLLLSSETALACFCVKSTPAENFQAADAVFYGKVVSVDDQSGARFQVGKSWQLVGEEEAVVYTGDPAKEGCAWEFRKGESYIVYASMQKGKLYTDQCSGTTWLLYAEDQLRDVQGRPEIPLKEADSRVAPGFKMKVALITAVSVLLSVSLGLALKVIGRRAA